MHDNILAYLGRKWGSELSPSLSILLALLLCDFKRIPGLMLEIRHMMMRNGSKWCKGKLGNDLPVSTSESVWNEPVPIHVLSPVAGATCKLMNPVNPIQNIQTTRTSMKCKSPAAEEVPSARTSHLPYIPGRRFKDSKKPNGQTQTDADSMPSMPVRLANSREIPWGMGPWWQSLARDRTLANWTKPVGKKEGKLNKQTWSNVKHMVGR